MSSERITIDDIMERFKVPKRNIYRWMEAHPNLTARDPDSKLGHPFPQPVDKIAKGRTRANVWDEDEVEQWWADNCKTIGRHPVESPVIVMKWDDYRAATLVPPERWTDDDGVEHVNDHLKLIEEVNSKLGDVRLTFRSASDAVWFRLRF